MRSYLSSTRLGHDIGEPRRSPWSVTRRRARCRLGRSQEAGASRRAGRMSGVRVALPHPAASCRARRPLARQRPAAGTRRHRRSIRRASATCRRRRAAGARRRRRGRAAGLAPSALRVRPTHIAHRRATLVRRADRRAHARHGRGSASNDSSYDVSAPRRLRQDHGRSTTRQQRGVTRGAPRCRTVRPKAAHGVGHVSLGRCAPSWPSNGYVVVHKGQRPRCSRTASKASAFVRVLGQLEVVRARLLHRSEQLAPRSCTLLSVDRCDVERGNGFVARILAHRQARIGDEDGVAERRPVPDAPRCWWKNRVRASMRAGLELRDPLGAADDHVARPSARPARVGLQRRDGSQAKSTV